MNQKPSTPVSTTATSMRPGYCRGIRRQGGFTPSVPGRERGSLSARAKVPCCRIWPNGEFGISYHNRTEESDPLPSHQWTEGTISSATIQKGTFWTLAEQWIVAGSQWVFLPWLVKCAKSAHRSETYGRQGITVYGQKVVRSGAYLLQQKYGKDRLSFLTLTVPSLGFRDEARIAEDWAYLTKSLLQSLRRRLQKAGLPGSVVAVTELQPKRLQGREPGCLHLHLVFCGRRARCGWAYSCRDYRLLWLGLLGNLLGRKLPESPCENVQRVEKDASQYLSKYLTKGVQSVAELADIVGWERVPRQWWTCSVSVKRAVKKYTVTGELAAGILSEIVEMWQKEGSVDNTLGVKFIRPITISLTKRKEYTIGFWGKLTRETYEDMVSLVGMLKSA